MVSLVPDACDPKVKFSPTTTAFAPSVSSRTLRKYSSGSQLVISSSKAMTSMASIP